MKRAAVSGAKIVFTSDFDEALKDAGIVYGMSHYSMGQSPEGIEWLKKALSSLSGHDGGAEKG